VKKVKGTKETKLQDLTVPERNAVITHAIVAIQGVGSKKKKKKRRMK
jgi:hypothetical protein